MKVTIGWGNWYLTTSHNISPSILIDTIDALAKHQGIAAEQIGRQSVSVMDPTANTPLVHRTDQIGPLTIGFRAIAHICRGDEVIGRITVSD